MDTDNLDPPGNTKVISNLCISYSLSSQFFVSSLSDNCGDYCVDVGIDYLSWTSPGIGQAISFLCIQGLTYFCIVFFIESGLSRRIRTQMMSGSSSGKVGDAEYGMEMDGHVDSDVYEEKQRIQDLDVQV